MLALHVTKVSDHWQQYRTHHHQPCSTHLHRCMIKEERSENDTECHTLGCTINRLIQI